MHDASFTTKTYNIQMYTYETTLTVFTWFSLQLIHHIQATAYKEPKHS